MSREIKFRAWDKGDNEIRDVMEYHCLTNELGLCSVPSRKFRGGRHTIHLLKRHIGEVVLMQYTGLRDKNGVEIYEGDVVKWGHLRDRSRENPHRIAEVKFDPDIKFDSQVGTFNFGSFAYRNSTEEDLEVIGNIYENPELIQ